MRGKETVTVVRKPKVDKLKPASGPTAEIEIEDCFVIPRGSYERDRGWVQVSGFTIWAPAGSPPVRADDLVRVRGELYSVEGEPGDFGRKRGPSISITVGRVGATNG